MAKNIFILEDDKINIKIYEEFLKDFNLFIYDNIDDAIDFVHSIDFNKIDLAILDVNLGTGLRISGFNVAFQIIKIHSFIPMIICTAHTAEEKIEKYAKLIHADLIKKPIKLKIIDFINAILNRKVELAISELEQKIREYITGAEYLKQIINIDLSIPQEVLDTVDKLEIVENKIIEGLSYFREASDSNFIVIDPESKDKKLIEFRDDLLFYIKTLSHIVLVESSFNSNEDISESETEFVNEIISLGQEILELLQKG